MSETAFMRQWIGKIEGDIKQGDPIRLAQSGAFERLARIGRHLFDVDICVALPPSETHWICALGEILQANGHAFRRQLGRHSAMLVADTLACQALSASTLVSKDPAVRFIAWATVIANDEDVPLSVVLADREPRVWTDDSVVLFGHFLDLSADVLRGELIGQEYLRLTEENRKLQTLATIDHLTGLWNRESILDIFDREIERCSRQKLPISAIVADLDHFKLVNDNHGHLAGDAVLEEVGRRLRRAVRSYDSVGRVGGEEFLIVMSDCNEVTAASVAERVHHVIRNEPVIIGDLPVSVTISQGLVTHSGPEKTSLIRLFEKADQALYQAKAKGRDGIQRDTDAPA